jgi:hypothetical protein
LATGQELGLTRAAAISKCRPFPAPQHGLGLAQSYTEPQYRHQIPPCCNGVLSREDGSELSPASGAIGVNYMRKSRTVIYALILLLMSAPSAFASRSSSQPDRHSSKDGYIQIDGKKNPELIPDHVLWKHVFRFFSSESAMPEDLKHTLESKELPMPSVDYSLLRQYANKHAVTEQELVGPISKIQQTFIATTDKKKRLALNKELRALELAQRYKTLELADAMMAKLSDEARLMLWKWTQDFKTDISFTIREVDLEYFRQPR